MSTLHKYTTRGGKYAIALQITHDGFYQIEEFKHTRSTGVAFLGHKDIAKAQAELTRRIEDSAKYDGIFYTLNITSRSSEAI